jgi:DUF1365 family protein
MAPTALAAETDALASALYVGSVRHRRRSPTRHAFRYAVYHVLVDVDELARLDREVRGFGWNRPALTSFRDDDHLGASPLPVREKLRQWLAGEGVVLPSGPVRVLTNLRVLGHVFNPVSWWFCHHEDGRLAFVVAEVNNTFGEAHCYLLDDLDVRADGTVRASAAKVFHVSPFLPIEGLEYRFTFVPPGPRVLAHMDVLDGDETVLDATQVGRRVPLRTGTLVRALLRYPLVTLHTVVRIHLQAARLAWRRVPFHRKPASAGYARLGPPDPGPRSEELVS